MGEHEENFIFEMGYNKGFKDGIKGSIPKDQYEARLKADMVAMLEKLVLELYESYEDNDMVRIWYIREFIQYRIDKLKENKE